LISLRIYFKNLKICFAANVVDWSSTGDHQPTHSATARIEIHGSTSHVEQQQPEQRAEADPAPESASGLRNPGRKPAVPPKPEFLRRGPVVRQ
jgi:hypothetical protein